MMAFNTLRIDAGDGSPVVDYRIENGRVASRVAEAAADGEIEQQWQQLTPEEISAHVTAGTVVAHWLLRRMGFYRLMRACTPDYSPPGNDVQDHRQRTNA
jgi:hypothetical protein